jgi:hypothetical protein
VRDIDAWIKADLPVTACDIDDGQYNLVWEVVYIEQLPAQSLFLSSQMYFIENDDVDEIHDNRRPKKDAAEARADNK